MIRPSCHLVAAVCASMLLTGAASAQMSPPAASAPAAKTGTKSSSTEKSSQAPRTAASLECSTEADGKSLHGKDRKKFMSSCKKDAKAKSKAN